MTTVKKRKVHIAPAPAPIVRTDAELRESYVSGLIYEYERSMRLYRQCVEALSEAENGWHAASAARCSDGVIRSAARARAAQDVLSFIWRKELADTPWTIRSIREQVADDVLRLTRSRGRSTSPSTNLADDEYASALAELAVCAADYEVQP